MKRSLRAAPLRDRAAVADRTVAVAVAVLAAVADLPAAAGKRLLNLDAETLRQLKHLSANP